MVRHCLRMLELNIDIDPELTPDEKERLVNMMASVKQTYESMVEEDVNKR